VLVEAHAAGVLLSGMSAGAMCWFESGLTDSFWGAGYQPLACLGLLPGACGVHYHADPQRRTTLLAAIEAGTVDSAIAIDDYAAVLYEDGVLSRVVHWREAAAAYSVARQSGQVVESALASISIANPVQ